MTFLKLETDLFNVSSTSICQINEEVIHYTTFASTALLGFIIILGLSLICLTCVVFLCLRSHHKLNQHETTATEVLLEAK